MADRKISDLTALTAQASGDLIPIVDVSEAAAADKNKSITVEELFQDIPVSVGIGASSPGSILTVQASGTQEALFSARANAGAGGGMTLQTDASDDGLLKLYDSAGAVQVQLDTDGGDNYIALGNVGIGISSPDTFLHVHAASAGSVTANGSAQLVVENSADAGINILSPNTAEGWLMFGDPDDNFVGGLSYDHTNDLLSVYANNSERMTISSAGRVGIGVTSPATTLHLGNSGILRINNQDGTRNLDLFNDNTNAEIKSSTDPIRINAAHSSGYIRFDTNDTERVRITSSGQTGIGTSNPQRDLHIHNSNSSSNAYLHLTSATTGTTTSDGLSIWQYGSGGLTDAVIALRENASLQFRTNDTERMRISNGGKLTVPGVWNGTTTGGSPVYVETDGDLLRYTSSLKYKTDVETVEDARADAILNCRPVWYRSKCENDIKTEGSEKSDWGWYGFIAEEVAEIEPRLVNWATKDAVIQEDGSAQSVERDPADYEAEGVRYDNFVPLLLNLIKRQKGQIEAMEARLAALEAN